MKLFYSTGIIDNLFSMFAEFFYLNDLSGNSISLLKLNCTFLRDYIEWLLSPVEFFF